MTPRRENDRFIQAVDEAARRWRYDVDSIPDDTWYHAASRPPERSAMQAWAAVLAILGTFAWPLGLVAAPLAYLSAWRPDGTRSAHHSLMMVAAVCGIVETVLACLALGAILVMNR